ncbi:MAG: NUDIX domain-containing protein [Candidatus Woesearchaeota archaeon]
MPEDIQPIVDSDDNIIGYKPRSLVGIDDIYRVATLWIRDRNGRFLLSQRSLSKERHPGYWGPAVTGTVEKGETYQENSIREAEEELGIKGLLFKEGPKIFRDRDWRFFCQYFILVLDWPEDRFRIQKSEVERVKWFTREEIESELVSGREKFLTASVRTMLDYFD